MDSFLTTYSLQTTRLRRRIPGSPFRDVGDLKQIRSILLGSLLQGHWTLLVLSIHVLLQHVSGKSKDEWWRSHDISRTVSNIPDARGFPSIRTGSPSIYRDIRLSSCLRVGFSFSAAAASSSKKGWYVDGQKICLKEPLWCYLEKKQAPVALTSCNWSDLELYSRLLRFCNDKNVLLIDAG